MKTVTINADQRLFVIPASHGGYSCLGFDVLESRAIGLARELAALGESVPQPEPLGTIERYAQYSAFVEMARRHNAKTGWRSQSELTPELIGREGQRVEIVHEWETGRQETVRFWVGKSTGFIPCHLEIKTTRSTGGGAVCLGKIKSVRTIRTK